MGVTWVLCTAGATFSCREHSAPTGDQVESAAVRKAWSDFAQCMLGGPLREDERPSDRLAALDLAPLSHFRCTQRPPSVEPWPQRCEPFLAEMQDAIPRMDQAQIRAQFAPFAEQIEVARSRAQNLPANWLQPSTDVSRVALIDAVWDEAERAGLPRSVARSPTPAPVPAPIAPLLRDTDLPELASAGVRSLTQAPIPDDRVLLADSHGSRLCRVGDDTLACGQPGPVRSHIAVPVSASPGATTEWLWDQEPEPGLYRSDGSSIAAPFTRNAWATTDGSIVDVIPEGRGATLLKLTPDHRLWKEPLEVPTGFELWQQMMGVVFFLEKMRGRASLREVMVRRIGASWLGPPVRVGSLHGVPRYPLGCMAGPRSFFAWRSESSDGKPARVGMLVSGVPLFSEVHDSGPWLPLADTPDEWESAWGFGGLSCHDTVSWPIFVNDKGSITQLNCAEDNCRSSMVYGRMLPSEELSALRLMHVEGGLLVVWAGHSPTRLGSKAWRIGARFAQPFRDQFEVTLASDALHGGGTGLHDGLWVVADYGGAAVFFLVDGTLRGVRVNRNPVLYRGGECSDTSRPITAVPIRVDRCGM